MAALTISLGQHSDKGRKPSNQDFYGAYLPSDLQRATKGIAIALADGISSSEVSREASEAAVGGFLTDYYATPATWAVKTSAQRVLQATNAWLYAQTRQSQYRYNLDRGYVCTLSAMVIKSTTAHLFHVGDSRIYQLAGNTLEPLTEDHRFWASREVSHLSRAMGASQHLELDYSSVSLSVGDVFVLTTDGVYEWLTGTEMVALIHAHWGDLDAAAEALIAAAIDNGSDDNLTVQIVRIDSLPERHANELYAALSTLPSPSELRAGSELDGYRIVRQLHASSRSHVYLAEELESGEKVALKTLSTELSQDPASIERFVREEWIARRIDNQHVLKAPVQERPRHYLYTVLAYIEGQTLTQWMRDHPNAELASVRPIVEQIAKGLRAFHRLEMLHQDLRPDNVMIDSHGTVKLIDFGAAKVAGLADEVNAASDDILGTAQYTAPEYFLGEGGTSRSDQYSLAVITYQMLTGTLPYGTEVAKTRTRAAQHKLAYQSALSENRELPAWVDEVLKKALHPNPHKRFPALSEFIFELRSPSQEMLKRAQLPLLERDPVLFWKGVSLVLALVVIALLLR
ncbi:bifunctional protein-serine/threonine kinase/phosphatase [Halomonas sp. FeN2]|uniref:bifunctional protein-serine/threonine kinase/phosphatase n=1 Tax=Halomonas sp. FeN2 TaxID=2832500 RepID=UPI000C45CA9A|nr:MULTISPECIES: bifunctional protein-serine/threonine kinase/phosphatase [unclassified Halomonas]MBF59348.1 protein kinase [Halomonas sp.]UBR48970.1 bifunctional protein-serine/threonine kinase/phosphatase [Halomonas sp. FeN2]|tara:strand:+ start:1074 stop:2789 length:1716 start_codon:yes stop_codon:yes gene_type:complete